MNEQIILQIAKQLNVKVKQVEATLHLIEEGNTVPFIARYRKEVTSGLDEEQIRLIQEVYDYQENLFKRKEDVKRLIETQGKLTEELVMQIDQCQKLVEIEDIYRPYQQKRKTRASNAINAGLKPLAEQVMLQADEFDFTQVKQFVCDAYPDNVAVLKGVQDIIAEQVSDDAKVRERVRKECYQFGKIVTSKKKDSEDEKLVYQNYYDYSELIKQIAPHRVMAINRGEKEKILQVAVQFDKQVIENIIISKWITNKNSNVKLLVEEAILDGLHRLVYPSVEREIRSELSDVAHEKSIDIFSLNIEKLLLQAPLKNKMILGIDPAYRTGCKLAVVSDVSKVLLIDVIYPHPPVNQVEAAKKKVLAILKKFPIEIIAIGNGTASRETESFIGDLIKENHLTVQYTIVSEAGASVYSASELAKSEFPDLSVEQRSAISIARRVIDPLSELIKIDPQSIGVGQYQHDLPQKKLGARLSFVVEKAVNKVGVNINHASPSLLTYVAGLNMNIAKSIVAYREENGKIENREMIKKIPKIGAKTYTQAIGFLRIMDGDNDLDQTSIHPESYHIAEKLLSICGIDDNRDETQLTLFDNFNIEELAKACESDVYTIRDIINAFKNGTRDYREQFDAPLLKSGVRQFEDLKENEVLQGVVRNVVDFGAFVDIGIKNDGLIHISKFNKKVNHPSVIVAVGDIIEIEVYKIDTQREKVQLRYLKHLNKKDV